jgi:hypothetical protein
MYLWYTETVATIYYKKLFQNTAFLLIESWPLIWYSIYVGSGSKLGSGTGSGMHFRSGPVPLGQNAAVAVQQELPTTKI